MQAANLASLAFPLTVDRDFEITLLANMITLTPGTLSVDVSDDRKSALTCTHWIAPIPRRPSANIAKSGERQIMEAFR